MPLRQLAADLFQATDTCHSYVFRDGKHALLIDCGDGSVLDELPKIGVEQVDWILFTHHHREQCQGFPKFVGRNVQVAAPEAERAFFELPASFRKWRAALGDPHSVYGASYIRPPIEPIKLDRGFKTMDDFTWRGKEFWCLDTRGNSPGGMSYLLRTDNGWWAFTGDAVLSGGKLHTWFDSEWDYGFGKGLYALANAAGLLAGFSPLKIFPSHGPLPADPQRDLGELQRKLRELERHYLRGYELFRFAAAAQDRVSRPTAVPHLWQLTPHLYKFRGPDYWPNFTLLLADNGNALVIDCGLIDPAFLEQVLQRTRERLGLKQIEAVIVTHMHGDHCEGAPYLREKWGAKIWTHERVAPICRRPQDYDYSASLNTYGKPFESLEFDRILRDGETFTWENWTLAADWMPGQTEFAMCLHGEIDGRRVAFTGDNIFADPAAAEQTGHEAVVARNSCVIEESYLYAADYLHTIGRDLIIGGHSWVLDQPRQLIERYRAGAMALREAFAALCDGADYRYAYDPYWVRAVPYRVSLRPGESAEIEVQVRNFLSRRQRHAIRLCTPAGLQVEPMLLNAIVGAESTRRHKMRVAAGANAAAGLHIVAFDITLDDARHGQLFDFAVRVEE